MKFSLDLRNDDNQPNIERLKTLYALMSGIPSKKIDMDSWRQENSENANISDKKLLVKCGTQACALGWAAAYPEFKKAGLKINSEGWPVYRYNDSGFDSGADFFGLTYDQANFLFSPEGEESSELENGKNFDSKKTQKQIALDRIAALLWKINVIDRDRFKTLLAESKAQAQAEAADTCCTL